MKNLKKISYVIVSLILLQFLFFFSAPAVRAETSVPDNFNQNLDLNRIYIYNVTAFNTTKPLEWRDVVWMVKGFVNTTPGGQMKINLTGFYEKDPNDLYNLFESPMPYMNIEFLENRSGILFTNNTLYNVSNGEADSNLAFGYNQFKSGFLIPINNITGLKEQAYAQNKSGFWEADVNVEETDNRITFNFQQKSGFQKTISTYDKISGLLLYTNTSAGNYTLEMTLINLPSFSSDSFSIPSFHLLIVITILGATILINICLKKKHLTKKYPKYRN